MEYLKVYVVEMDENTITYYIIGKSNGEGQYEV
jgi:hypothetical protein